jgi:hypothetical protein
MTPLARTYPEPAGDIAAQMAALVDPLHPKRAVWVSAGTVVGVVGAVPRLSLPAGTLYARLGDLDALVAEPSLETLARILDYVECRSPALAGFFQLPVVQALSPDGWVVQEQLVGWGRVGEARRRARAYGRVRVVSVGGCLGRRARLLAAEGRSMRNAPARCMDARIGQCRS